MSECDAQIAWLGRMQCGQPAVGHYRCGCVHEHVRDGWLCQDHVDHADAGLCRACNELPGGLSHECPITLQPLEVTP